LFSQTTNQNAMKIKLLATILLSVALLVAIILLTSFTAGENEKSGNQRANTAGIVTFTATTSNPGGTYNPKHVLAIWVEKNGVFVKTRKAMANARKQYLYMWHASSNYNVIDAITGPTLTSHQTHTVTWDCTDVNGNIVADGDYTVILEFTDKHAQGPFVQVNFTKGTEPVTLNPANQTYIKNISLTYTPMAANFTANVTQVCTAQNIIFTDNSTGATSWAWTFGTGASPATANTQGPHTVSYSSPGNKTVTLTINGAVTETKTDYITVYANPVAGFSWDQSDLTVSFTNTSQNANSYLWDFGDGNTSTETNPVHVFAGDGTYVVNLTAYNEMCGNESFAETLILSTIGISEPELGPGLQVFPNPSNGNFSLSSDIGLNNLTLKLYNLQGKIMLETNIGSINKQESTLITTNYLAAGMYFMDISADQRNFRKKLFIR
jgi:PKD repeat protein